MTTFYEAKKLNTKLQVLKVWYISWSIPVKWQSNEILLHHVYVQYVKSHLCQIAFYTFMLKQKLQHILDS